MKLILATSISLLLLLPACGAFKKRSQLPQSNQSNEYAIKNNVALTAHHLTRAEINQTFGTRGRKLGYYGLCPIEVFIKNNGTDTLVFDPANTTLEYANHEHVAYCLQNYTVRNTVCLASIGLLATSIACIYTLPFAAWFYITGIGTAGLYIGASTATGMLILTPTVAVYYAKNSYGQNRRISQDIKQIAPTQTQSIEPGQELQVILFTKKKNCKKDFTVTLINEATQESINFDVIH